ncbi:uncharacterized protein L199_004947 [Kwoniella botswanensis]|uniref:uncharacterized protein n=1 Tax=Kwoniella botswanensis TaxID=1268659 RepID=UPI00315CEE1B
MTQSHDEPPPSIGRVQTRYDTSEEIAKRAKVTIEKVSAEQLPLYAPRLSAIIHAHMLLGMSTFFTFPYTLTDSLHLFNNISSQLVTPSAKPSFPPPLGGIAMLVAKLYPSEQPLESIDMEGNPTAYPEIVGSVQLGFASMPNGAFRSEVKKMLVDTRYGGRGVGKALLRGLEEEARKWGSTTCMLDTEQNSFGEKLYRSCGWIELGVLPRFHWPPDKSQQRSTVFFYKHLDVDEDNPNGQVEKKQIPNGKSD